MDTETVPCNEVTRRLKKEYSGMPNRYADWEKFDLCVTSPGFAADSPMLQAAAAHDLKVISEMEYGFLYYNGKILAITGTNGKTTTYLRTASGVGLCR